MINPIITSGCCGGITSPPNTSETLVNLSFMFVCFLLSSVNYIYGTEEEIALLPNIYEFKVRLTIQYEIERYVSEKIIAELCARSTIVKKIW